MPIRGYAPLCLTRTLAGEGLTRLGVDLPLDVKMCEADVSRKPPARPRRCSRPCERPRFRLHRGEEWNRARGETALGSLAATLRPA